MPKITTSVSKEEYKRIWQLRESEDIHTNDLIRVALMVRDENPELFYAVMYRIKHAKAVRA
ncbi:MAG: hypothetical protein ACPL3C_07810 [Pyrobaculum sp.]